MTVKYNSKNRSVFGKIQSVEGTAVTPITTDAIPVTDLTNTTNQETESFQYLGDSLSRDEETTLKDTSGEVNFTSFMPVLGVLDTGLAVADAPYSQWLQACGAEVTVSSDTGIVTATNKNVSTSLLTIDVMKDSPDATDSKQKRYRYPDCRGMVDLVVEASSKTTLGFKYLGNEVDPTMETAVVADYANQKFNVASVVRLVNMQLARVSQLAENETAATMSDITGDGTDAIATIPTHTLLVDEGIEISGTTNFDGTYPITSVTGTTVTFAHPYTGTESSGDLIKRLETFETMCINSVNATNYFGYAYNRYLMTCQEGFSKEAEPTDVAITVLEDEIHATADFNPDANIENFFEVELKYGVGDGKYTTLIWNKLQLATTANAQIGSFEARDIGFRNTGNATIIFS